MAAIATPTRRILCILDLNGVMLARLNPQEHKLARTAAAAAGRDLPPRAGSVGKRPVFVRPFSTHFTNLLLDGGVPGIDVAVWTSAAPANARKLADLVLGSGDGRSDKFAFVWSRDQCTAVDERGLPWATIKDLRNVYKAFPHHTPATTLIVDDSLSKCRLNPANALLVPSWNLVDPQENEVEDPNLDTTLVDLLAYLKVMQRSAPSDVREYIAARPFANATRVRANGGQGIGPGAPIVTYVANRHPTWEVVAGSEPPLSTDDVIASLTATGSWVDLTRAEADADDADAMAALSLTPLNTKMGAIGIEKLASSSSSSSDDLGAVMAEWERVPSAGVSAPTSPPESPVVKVGRR